MIRRLKKPHIALIILLIMAFGLYMFWYGSDDPIEDTLIREYEPNKDFNSLLNIMNENLFWLSERKEFSPEKVLNDRAPFDNPKRKGEALIDVLEYEGEARGFIAYFKNNFEEGHIWLLAVDKNYRGMGFGEKLVRAAVKHLKERKASYITISTRSINTPALKLYKLVGFLEQSTNERGIVSLILRNP